MTANHRSRYVAQNVQWWRQERRLTIRELAALVGMSHSGISDIEHGRRHVTVDHLIALAEALHVDVAVFFVEPPLHHAGAVAPESGVSEGVGDGPWA